MVTLGDVGCCKKLNWGVGGLVRCDQVARYRIALQCDLKCASRVAAQSHVIAQVRNLLKKSGSRRGAAIATDAQACASHAGRGSGIGVRLRVPKVLGGRVVELVASAVQSP